MSSPAEHEPQGQQPEQRLTSADRIELVRDSLQTWREGFLAYLLLPGVDLSDPKMADRFTDCYAGWYPDRRSFCEAQMDAIWWRDALDEFSAAHELPGGALDFNWDAIWAHCREVYDVVEQLGGVHVFTR